MQLGRVLHTHFTLNLAVDFPGIERASRCALTPLLHRLHQESLQCTLWACAELSARECRRWLAVLPTAKWGKILASKLIIYGRQITVSGNRILRLLDMFNQSNTSPHFGTQSCILKSEAFTSRVIRNSWWDGKNQLIIFTQCKTELISSL